jgi:uncharacterized membrane protein YcgQ (UPF0703/DUF1980 family)
MYVVIVENNSNAILTNCIIDGGGIYEELGDIDPDEVMKHNFWIKQDGTLSFHFQKDHENIEIIIDGYVTNGDGGLETVTIE